MIDFTNQQTISNQSNNIIIDNDTQQIIEKQTNKNLVVKPMIFDSEIKQVFPIETFYKNLLTFKQVEVKIEKQVETTNVQIKEEEEKEEEKETKITKKSQTIKIVNEMINKFQRKDIIQKIMSELNMSKPGASTYYQNVKSGLWK